MSEHIENLLFNGQPPDIVGQLCNGLVVQSFYDGASLTDQANVVFFRFGDTWHRIYFEAGIVFWRTGEAPENPVNSTISHGLLLNNLSEMTSVVGHHLARVAYSATPRGDVSVECLFESGAGLSLTYDTSTDSTRIHSLPKGTVDSL